jgi:hypothetical protein
MTTTTVAATIAPHTTQTRGQWRGTGGARARGESSGSSVFEANFEVETPGIAETA